jgi:cobaltochelatase CobT subunit
MRRDDLLTAGFVLLGCLALAILIPGDLISKGLNSLGLIAVWVVVALFFVIFRSLRWGLRAARRRRAAITPVATTSVEALAPDYRVYTRDFDVTADARMLDGILGKLQPKEAAWLDEAWETYSHALVGWRAKIEVAALDATARIKGAIDPAALASSTVSILVDQSGSMRGQSMLLAAAATDVASDFLVRLGLSVDVLGFTTVGWHGGKSRKRWLQNGSPQKPGRVADLLHVIYRSAEDQRHSTGGWSFRSMLRPDLPKENIDGEALEWAASRLREREATRRFLIVISDGVPCDDATLKANDPSYLYRHLSRVIQELQAAKDIEVAAIGIGVYVNENYENALAVSTPEELGGALVGLLERLICGLQPRGTSDQQEVHP